MLSEPKHACYRHWKKSKHAVKCGSKLNTGSQKLKACKAGQQEVFALGYILAKSLALFLLPHLRYTNTAQDLLSDESQQRTAQHLVRNQLSNDIPSSNISSGNTTQKENRYRITAYNTAPVRCMWLLNKLTMPYSKKSPKLPYDYEAIDKALAANNDNIFTPDSFNELYAAALATQEATGDSKEQYRRHNLLYGLLERRTGKKLKLALNSEDKAAGLLASRTEFLNLAVNTFLESESDSGNDIAMFKAETQSKANAGSLGSIGVDDTGMDGSEAGESVQDWDNVAGVGSLEADAIDLNSDYESLATWRDKLQAHADWLNQTEAALREKDRTIDTKWREAEKTMTEVKDKEKDIYKKEKEVASREKDVATKVKEVERREKDLVKREMEVQKKEVGCRKSSFATNQLSDELRNVRRALNQAEQEKKDLEGQVASVEIRNAASERLGREKQEKQENNNLHNDGLFKLTTETRILKAGNDLRNTEIAKLNTKIRELEEEKSNTNRLHKHEISKLTTRINELEGAASTLRASRLTQAKVVGDQKRQVAVLRKENVNLEGVIAAKEAAISQLQRELDIAKETPNNNTPDHSEIEKLKEEITELEIQVSSMEGIEAQVFDLEREKSQLQSELELEKGINKHQTLALIPKLRGEIAELKENIQRQAPTASQLPDSFIPDHVAARVQFLHSGYATNADRKRFKTEVADLWALKHGDRGNRAATAELMLDSIKEKLREGLVIPSARELRNLVRMLNEVLYRPRNTVQRLPYTSDVFSPGSKDPGMSYASKSILVCSALSGANIS
ncbi:uncharacterized protein MYCFIDRAFT_84015 [Pseudocercospora fijiensis CIRAD86]|uniref:Uncharacterized protein n=1 Tax=Pseudocercospora fijiensis (strain CIRAD86) TaxID=383855 RepID=M2ZYM0_PSEFD|nr:uncharacterized protein MYCFIDRAFT_84015 [Pseudocercospora fijiensis CIRAD86]EME77211.1 hypothetical protein MYCFIDRAFT_84015 [Pseudocercospora fijiensis CIRAD86]